jgi:hypothetical protein
MSAHLYRDTAPTLSMEILVSKPTDAAPATSATSAPQPLTTQPPSPPHLQSGHKTDPKNSIDAPDDTTPPFSPTSQTPVLQKEQEEFEGTVDANNDIPTAKDLSRVADLLVLDARGQSRPFKELYQAPLVAPRQLIIFIRHFFCGVSAANATLALTYQQYECRLTCRRTARNTSARFPHPSSPTISSRYPRQPSLVS